MVEMGAQHLQVEFAEHIRTKSKKNMKIVARFFTDGGKDAMEK